MDGFTNSTEHIEERGLDFTPHSEYPHPTRTDPNLHPHPQELPVNQALVTTTSSDKMLANSTSTLPDISRLEVSLPPPLSTNLNGCGVFNNYLFRQDPTTGHLSLVPVQVRAPESLLGLDINLSLVPQPLQGLITAPESTDGPFINCLNAPVRPEPQDYGPPSSYFKGGSIISDSPPEHRVPRAYNGQTDPGTQGEEQSASKVHPALQEVIDLLKGEFSLDGYMDNGHEDIAMGMDLYDCNIIFIIALLLLYFLEKPTTSAPGGTWKDRNCDCESAVTPEHHMLQLRAAILLIIVSSLFKPLDKGNE